MKMLFPTLGVIISASFMIGCGAPVANNSAANKPANTANANAAAPVNTAAIESDLKKLISDYAASTAKNDVDALDKATTDNFMFVSTDGTVQTKAERITSMKSGQTKYESLTYDDVNVRVNPQGDGAVAIGKATVKVVNNGKPINGAVRVTQVWSKTKDGWKMASLQATPITAKADDKAKSSDDLKSDNAPSALEVPPASKPAESNKK